MNNSLFLNKTYSRNELKGLLEAILFVKGKSVPTEMLENIFEAKKTEIESLINELNEEYNNRKSGLCIIPVAGGYQLVSNPGYKDELAELFGKRNEAVLPKSCLETLAIIAYKQPISKEEIDKIRGVSSTRSLNSLLALKLINIVGSTEDVVKSPLYSTTERFLEFFRITSLEDLPSIESVEFNKLLESESFYAEEESKEEENNNQVEDSIPFE